MKEFRSKIQIILKLLAMVFVLPPLHAQEWSLQLTITGTAPGNSLTQSRAFGGDASATYGYDARLDKITPPQAFSFYSCFSITVFPHYLETDIREWVAPYKTGIDWELRIENTAESGVNMVTVVWDPAALPSVAGNFTIDGIDMRGKDSISFFGDRILHIIYTPRENCQVLDFDPGWNWFSLNLNGADMSLNTVLAGLGEHAEIIKNQTAFATYYAGFGWYSLNGLDFIDTTEMYMIKMGKAAALTFSGTPVDYLTTPIELVAGWNWIGYLPQRSTNLNEALPSIADCGDLIKNQTAWATYYTGSGWHSSNGLDVLAPGEGYMLRMVRAGTLIYGAPPGGLTKKFEVSSARSEIMGWKVNTPAFEHSMAVTGMVLLNDSKLNVGYGVVAAFAGEECRGVSSLKYFPLAGRYVFGMLVYGNEDEAVRFELYDASTNRAFYSDATLRFQVDGIIGNGLRPFKLRVSNNGDVLSQLPLEYCLKPNYPNPFNPETVIRYQIPEDGNVTVEIYNMRGQLIRVLIDEHKPAGTYHIAWDGRDDSGDRVASGIYLYVMRSGNFLETMKAVLSR